MNREKSKKVIAYLTSLILVSSIFLANTATAESTSTNSSIDLANVNQQMTDFEGRYSSMTAAMVVYYAANRGQALGAFLTDNPKALANLSGSGAGMTDIFNKANQAKTPEELSRILSTSGIGLNVNSWTSLAAANADIKSNASSMDAAVVSAGMSWASALSQIHVPVVQAPGIPDMNTTLATSMPKEGLVFGLFMNQSLANLIGNFPDVFSQVNSTGVASPTASEAWKKAMQAAAAGSYTDLSQVAGGNVCGAAFVDGLTGNSTKGCSPCAIAGMYGNAQLSLLFNPAAGSKALDPRNPAVSATEWSNLSPAQRSAIVAQNPGIANNVDGALNGNNGCNSISPAVQTGASTAVKKVLDFLNGK